MALIRWAILLLLLGGSSLWWLSRPIPLDAGVFPDRPGDPDKGAAIFWAGGCASCHAAPDATGDALRVLSGGYRIKSPFGTFVTPNISPSPQGLGGWDARDLANALIAGVSPASLHYYPSLPYTTYHRMQVQDAVDLWAFLATLPASDRANEPHEIGFPFNIRRGLGLWKRLYLTPDWVMQAPATGQLKRGRYLVEALGHCAECHTPRGPSGGLDRSRWMAGAPNPSGKGNIPSLTPDKFDWSAGDIAYYLETGFTPDFDSAGGQMARVVENMARLPAQDRAAIAAYIKALP